MSGPLILIGPLNGFIVATVLASWIGDDWSNTQSWMFSFAGAFVGLLVTIWLINDEAKAGR